MEAELAKFNAVQARLREVIREIVKRHAVSGKPLSWKLMFEIEEEALAVLCRQRDLDAGYVRLMSAPPASAERRRDEPVGIHDLSAMHIALWMIQEAYYHPH